MRRELGASADAAHAACPSLSLSPRILAVGIRELARLRHRDSGGSDTLTRSGANPSGGPSSCGFGIPAATAPTRERVAERIAPAGRAHAAPVSSLRSHTLPIRNRPAAHPKSRRCAAADAATPDTLTERVANLAHQHRLASGTWRSTMDYWRSRTASGHRRLLHRGLKNRTAADSSSRIPYLSVISGSDPGSA